jgi:hypothetical protein
LEVVEKPRHNEEDAGTRNERRNDADQLAGKAADGSHDRGAEAGKERSKAAH